MEPKTILLVDDDREIRTFTQRLLERAGYKVLAAVDGEDGLSVYRAQRGTLGLLLTDVSMPRMNGVDLADRILQLDSELPILLMTGGGFAAPVRYEYIAKPVAPAELIRRVDEALVASQRLQGTRASAVGI